VKAALLVQAKTREATRLVQAKTREAACLVQAKTRGACSLMQANMVKVKVKTKLRPSHLPGIAEVAHQIQDEDVEATRLAEAEAEDLCQDLCQDLRLCLQAEAAEAEVEDAQGSTRPWRPITTRPSWPMEANYLVQKRVVEAALRLQAKTDKAARRVQAKTVKMKVKTKLTLSHPGKVELLMQGKKKTAAKRERTPAATTAVTSTEVCHLIQFGGQIIPAKTVKVKVKTKLRLYYHPGTA